jgi:hypothetical protein
VAYMVAVFFGGEPRDSEFAAVDAQPRNVHGFRRCGICDLNDLLKVFVGLRLARAYLSRNASNSMSFPVHTGPEPRIIPSRN